jgi:hypothetical protein
MTSKHFVNLGEGILGEPDPHWLWKDQILSLSSDIRTDLFRGTIKLVAPCIGQASELKAIKELSGKYWSNVSANAVIMDKFVCFTNRTRRLYNVNVKWQDLLKLEGHEMQLLDNSVWLLNPPYNDGTAANNPIYQKFIEKVSTAKPRAAVIIVQANWLMRTDSFSKDIRKNLKRIGVKKITVNPFDAFPNAQVRTVSILCETGYIGDIELVDAVSKKSIQIKDFDELIPFCFDDVKVKLLKRLIPTDSMKLKSGPVELKNKFLVATAYQNFNIGKGPVGYIRLIEPGKKCTGYKVLEEYDTKEDAEIGLLQHRSFWHSRLITFIMKYRRTSYTLDNPQISWVPIVKVDHEFNDQELYNMFNLTDEEIATVEEEFGTA